jgi:FHS family L-fucose permease-like MFS transporter
MGWISDATGGNIQLSYVVPLLCFLVVLWFGFTQRKAAVVGAPADPHALQVA